MAEDWDLYAVVRSYTGAGGSSGISSTDENNSMITSPAAENTNPDFGGSSSSSLANLPDPFLNADDPSNFPGFVPHQEDSFQGLEEIYREQQHDTMNDLSQQYNQEFQRKPSPYAPQPGQFSLYPQHSQHHMVPPHHHHQQNFNVILGSSPLSFASSTAQPIRSRRRKNQQAKVVHRMTQEELSGDSWAWRKYGQKPIKGSPFPRNYYRCSTSKGCVARRQVERCPAEPNTYVVSYSGQHSHPRPTHRSSLAGSTRAKTAKPSTSGEPVINAAPTNISVASSSSPVSGSSFSPRAESAAEEGADAENLKREVMLGEEEEEGERWEDEDDDDDDDDDDNNGDGEILIPNALIDHY